MNLKTLSLYLLRLYSAYFIGILLLLIGVFILSNIFDILQKYKSTYIQSHFFWKLTIYKIPYLLNEVASLASFVAMLFFIRRLTKYNELLTISISGIHIWRILMPAVCATFVFGIILIAVVNPIGIVGLKKYEILENKLTHKKSIDLTLSQSGLLFFELYNEEDRIIQSQAINIQQNKLTQLIILFVNSNNYLIKRIDAQNAFLKDNTFILNKVKIHTDDKLETYESLIIPTNLSINKLVSNLVSPEMISIWDLPNSITQLTKSGLPVTNYQIYYYKQLFKPIMMVATVIMASCFISLKQRDNSQGKILIIAIFIGFTVYSLLEMLIKILAYNRFEPYLAVFLPNILIILISNYIILHMQEN